LCVGRQCGGGYAAFAYPRRRGVNFTIILRADFCTKVFLLAVWLCNFFQNKIGAKAACKILVKFTKSVNFTNIL